MMRMRRWGRRFHRSLWLSLLAMGLGSLALQGAAVGQEPDGGSAAGDGAAPAAAAGAAPTVSADRPSRVAVIRIDAGIFSGTADYMVEAIERAERGGYDALVLELDTPGGGLEETQTIVKRMLSARVPVVVFVSPKGAQAASAGTFLTMAANVAAMAPGTRIGAAHPVSISLMPGTGGDDKDEDGKKKRQQQDEIMNEKVTNDTVAFVVGVAKERGRNAEWAEQAVRESVSITADVALEKKVVDLIAENFDDLLSRIDGREIALDAQTKVVLRTKGAAVERWGMSLKQRLMSGLAHPNVLYLLFLIGIGGIAMEFYHPGAIVPGVVGALCLLLAFISMQILPVSWGGLLLVVIGLGMMIAEVYVSAYGMLGIGGGILMILGGILLIDPAAEPFYQAPDLAVDWGVLIPMAAILVLLFLYIGYFVVRTQRSRVTTGTEGMIGEVGTARMPISPSDGRVFVHGELWNARSQQPIPTGAAIVVLRVEGMVIHVKQKDS